MVHSPKMTKLLPPFLLVCFATRIAPAASNPSGITVTGIVDLPGYKCVLLESTDADSPVPRPESFTMQEGERDGRIEVLQIDAKAGAVKIRLERTNPIVTLHLESEVKTSVNDRETAPITIHLQHAALNPTLLLYGHLANRTVLRPTLAVGPVSLSSSATNQADAALALSKALAEQGLATVMDGEKFVMVVPADKVSMAVPHSAEIKSKPQDLEPAKPASGSPIIPGGEIDFPAIDIIHAAYIYAELLGGRSLDRSEGFPSSSLISVRTETPLTKEEAIYVFETLFRWQDIEMVPVGKDLITAVRISGK
ncbi:MAG: hypothetical protein JWR69_1779 [Pedosphaera sp.]|nr:hypothetical protein [Pedosphaera sp.]